MRTNTAQDMVGSFTFFHTQTTYQALRTTSRQNIVSHDPILRDNNINYNAIVG